MRPTNDDAFGVDRELGLLLVADGVSRRPAGDVASQLAVEAARAFLASPDTTWPDDDADVGVLLTAAVAVANRRVYQTGTKSALVEGMATTLVAAVAAVGGIWIAHVGDSRALRFRNHRLERLTVDHTVEHDTKVRSTLSPRQLLRHRPNVLTRAIGLRETVDVDLRFEKVLSGDVTLLASDGLTKVVSEAEIIHILSASDDLAMALTNLVDRANACGGPDNITILAGRWELNEG
jgi:serine/threonine protein phosphatase PrpC